MYAPSVVIVWVVFWGAAASSYFGDRYGEFGAWFVFATVAPMPLAKWRWDLREETNLFDWLGFAAVVGVWVYVGWLVVEDFGTVHPISLGLGFAIGALPAIGSYGLFAIPAFALERLPKPQFRGTVRRQMPYSVPDEGGEFTFNPAVFGKESGPSYREPAGREQGSSGPSAQPDWRNRIEDEREQRERAEKQRRQREEESRKRQAGQGDGMSYQDALDWFGMTAGFTLDELKSRFRELSKRMHPDQGGSNAQFRTLEQAYKVLKKHAR